MKPIPKLDQMTEKEREAWDKKIKEMEFDALRRDMYNKVSGGRGWIF